MLPKPLRLSIPHSQYVFRMGRTVKGPEFTFSYSPSSTNQFLVQAPKKIMKKAVSRNRVRRVFHESLRQLSPKITKPIQALIRVNLDLSPLPQGEILKLLTAALHREGLL